METETYQMKRAKWVAALRSGEYPQTRGRLRDNNGYCCFGVLCDIHDSTKWETRLSPFKGEIIGYKINDKKLVHGLPPKNILHKLKISPYYSHEMMRMNDGGKSFEDIAKYIENLP